ncbi:imidazolonepropionase [Spongiimicrobium salis]|uniref:imidazolonepropionase n=1 Tax=Spongiimicrobium salis TaxID=1667022 RepID=UPI00374D02A7
MNNYQLVGPFKQLLPMTGLPAKGALQDTDLELIENGGIIVHDGFIVAIGKYTNIVHQAKALNATKIVLDEDFVGLPGLIDAHTHICFAGSRAKDYALRNAGKTYLEIAQSGGGIWDTVTQTRNADQTALESAIADRAMRHLKNGITTIEVKSGYGLSVAEELKLLKAIKNANALLPTDLIPTCLAAHMLPKDYQGTEEDYLLEIATTLFPLLKKEKLSNRIDAFIETSAFSPQTIQSYFEKAVAMGFDLTVHADQFSTGGSELAVQFNAVSADHLEASTGKEIELLAKSNVVAMALPGASLGLGCNFTPARKLLDAGACLAIASDWNPGSAPMGNLLSQASILGTFEKLTNAEVLAGITTRAALALKLHDRGSLKTGNIADFIAFPASNYQEITYQQGELQPTMVWKKGILAHSIAK